ncbi:Uncharacterized protein SCF082_LOCUS21287 [Durusdinium trenchii]|uniref:Uncharacterized protein n=1 Tax=Durusdinium trenchii TaxID=1381693 RepID=A0ABP0LBA1_9DINO
MGQYFSLRGAEEWAETLQKTALPSIWSTATYTPLAKSKQILLTRPGQVDFFFPGSFKQGGDYVQVSEVAEVHIIAAYDVETGRCYSGLCLQAHPNFPHKFSRAVEEVKVNPQKDLEEETSPDASPSSIKKLSQQCSWMSRSPSGAKLSPSNRMAKSASRSSGLSMEKFGELDEPPPTREQQWLCCLFYAIKEGILVYFADDVQSCEQVVRSVQSRYRDVEDLAASLKAPTAPSSHPQAQICRHNVGGAPPVAGRIITRVLQEDLQREFQIMSPVEKQPDTTNCVVFCMRVVKGFQMALRGFDIVKAGESNPSIGRRAGDIAGEAWERLWSRI